MTWIYSSFAWRELVCGASDSSCPLCCVAVRVALLGRPLELQVLSSSLPRACSSTLTFPKSVLFSVSKSYKNKSSS